MEKSRDRILSLGSNVPLEFNNAGFSPILRPRRGDLN